MKDISRLWNRLDFIITRKYGGKPLTKLNLITHKHSLFIELHDGALCGTWVFPTQQLSISAIADTTIIDIISNFNDVGYLISLYIRDDE
jgi:hypothetical protein